MKFILAYCYFVLHSKIDMMQGLYSIGLLIVSNVFMTLLWAFEITQMKVINN